MNDFVGDCIASVNIFNVYHRLAEEQSKQNVLITVQRVCMSYLVIILDKWLEFYDRYSRYLPTDLHDECKKLSKELRSRNLEEFRNTCIGHIWDKKQDRPLYNSEIMARLNTITNNDLNKFMLWVNNPKNNVYPNTVVSVVETVRDRLIKDYNVDYNNEILNK